MTDKDPRLMDQYAAYLEEFVTGLNRTCDALLTEFETAVKCMDTAAQKQALKALAACVEEIKSASPFATDTARKLVLSAKYLRETDNVRYR